MGKKMAERQAGNYTPPILREPRTRRPIPKWRYEPVKEQADDSGS